MKLTKAQERVLRELSKPGAVAKFDYARNCWFLSTDDCLRVLDQLNALARRGLVEPIRHQRSVLSYDDWIINAAGRAWLAEHEQSPQGRKGGE